MWSGDAAGRPRVIAVALMGLLPLMPVLLNPYWVIVLGSALCLEELVDGRAPTTGRTWSSSTSRAGGG